MNAHRDPDRLVHDFLMEGQTELPDQVYDSVRATIEHKHQRVVIGPWRLPDIMNKLVPIALGAAAVVAVLAVGTQMLGPSVAGGGAASSATPSAPPSAPPSPTSPPATVGLPRARTSSPAALAPCRSRSTSRRPAASELPGLDAMTKDDDGLDPPTSVGAALLGWAWPSGTGFNVYGDPCHWTTTIPETPATTPDEIATALAAQSASDPTAPVDVTVGGFAGKAITLHVPMTYDAPDLTREERFADCDNDTYAFYGIEGETAEARNAQGAGQLDELWILDVDGEIVILDGTYSPATPVDLVEEMRTLAESATFE